MRRTAYFRNRRRSPGGGKADGPNRAVSRKGDGLPSYLDC